MDRNDYNIDEILSEVKRRKESENEPEHAEVAPAPHEPEEVQSADIAEEAPAEEEVPQEEIPAEPELSEEAPEDIPEDILEEIPEEEGLHLGDTADIPKIEDEAIEENDGDMVNLMELAESDDALSDAAVADIEPVAPPKPHGSKTKKILKAVIISLLVLILAGASVFLITANDWINDLLDNNDTSSQETTEEWQGMKKLVENFDPIQETEATELSSLQDMIKTWYYNGSPCSSSHVLNVLLIGEDTRGKNILDEGTRADSAIIVSVNVDTKKVVLTSILRDSWGYWENESGKKESGQFGKINGAMSLSDVKAYKRTIENLYKIKIDGHAIVNFDSFKSIVNTLGGVELELTAAEITEINSHPKTYGDVWITKKFEGDKGVQKLNGRQALAYCRIRHIDSDNARADRQKTCLIKIFEQAKGASTAKRLKIIKKLIPYVKTSFGKNEIIKIATYAFSEGWLNFDVETTNVPEMNLKGGNFKPEFGGQWIWRADFPADAYIVQKRIYGKSNITLARVRVDTKTVRQAGFFADGARATTNTYTNTAYGEESTVPTTKEDEE